ncbi:hypothetical protein ACJX0J_016370, partial [Zea mays]
KILNVEENNAEVDIDITIFYQILALSNFHLDDVEANGLCGFEEEEFDIGMALKYSSCCFFLLWFFYNGANWDFEIVINHLYNNKLILISNNIMISIFRSSVLTIDWSIAHKNAFLYFPREGNYSSIFYEEIENIKFTKVKLIVRLLQKKYLIIT